jgi:hypothetical protein
MKDYGYIPRRRHKFVAVEKATGHKALTGGVCKCTNWKRSKTGRCEFVEAIDYNNQVRLFIGNKWRFLKRSI